LARLTLRSRKRPRRPCWPPPDAVAVGLESAKIDRGELTIFASRLKLNSSLFVRNSHDVVKRRNEP